MPLLDPWSDEQKAGAQKMRDAGVSWEALADAYGCSVAKAKGEIMPGFRERQAIAQSEYRVKLAEKRRRNIIPLLPPERKNPVYDPKRDGVREPMDLTGQLLGDPFPGRAELMRRAG